MPTRKVPPSYEEQVRIRREQRLKREQEQQEQADEERTADGEGAQAEQLPAVPDQQASKPPPIVTHIGGLPGVWVSGPNA